MKSQNCPIAELSQLASRADSDRQAERARVRAISPELTAIMDELGTYAKMLHMTVDGVTVAGKPPAADKTATISGEFYLMACRLGAKK